MGQKKAMGRQAGPNSTPFHFRNTDTVDQEKGLFVVVCDLVHSEYVCRKIIFHASSAVALLVLEKASGNHSKATPLLFVPKLGRVNSG